MGFFLSTTVNAQEDELRRELSTLADTLRKEHGEWIRSDKTSPDPTDAAIPRFARIAERSRGTKTGSRSLILIIYYGGLNASQRQPVAAAIDGLIDNYQDSEVLGTLIRNMPMISAEVVTMRERIRILQRIAGAATRSEVQASALFHAGRFSLSIGGTRKQRQQRAKKYFARLVAQHPDSPFLENARNCIFEMDRLQIGMKVPEIEGEDLDGVAFRLSDYRGKVVMLDFWGEW